ncbi:MAG: hypothetical protein II928_02100 [Paludibacteraceae bacterium]|nr:hypothetical protein [Paludibacteraceae bacterium]
MKKFLSVCLIALCATANIMAQEVDSDLWDWRDRRHTLAISGGACSLFFPTKQILFGWIPAAAEHSRNSHYYGEYGLQYHYQVLQWMRVGFKTTWEGDGYDMYTGKEDTDVKKGYTLNHTVTGMASLQFTYFNREHFQVYAGLDAGAGGYIVDTRYDAGYADSDGNQHPVSGSAIFAFNITPVGIAGGNKVVFGYAELNIGFDAIFKAGIGFHL